MGGVSDELADELAFIRSSCPRFVPCHVEFDARKSRHRKVPALKSWTQITPDQSQELLALVSGELLAREKGMVLKRTNRVVPVYDPVSTYEAFLTTNLANNALLRAFPRRFNNLLVYMARVKDAGLPFIKRDRTYLGSRNSMLNLVSGELEYYGTLPAGASPRHYIDQVLQFDDLDTPLFDRIFC